MHINTLEKLSVHLENDRQHLPNLHLYLLFDSNLHSELNSTYFLLDDAPEYYPLFLNTHLEEHIHYSPYLVKVSVGAQKFIEWVFTYGKQWGFFYFSEHSLDEALKHWQSIIFRNPNDATNNTLFRIYDPKILCSLISDQKSQKAINSLLPCHSLYFQNENNQWIKYTPATSEIDSFSTIQKKQGYSLYVKAISKRCELILWDKSPQLMEKFSCQSLDAAIQQGICIALKSGFTQQHSILTFLRLWLERGPATLSSEETQHYLLTPELSYMEKIHHLRENIPPEDTWNQAPKPPIII